MSGFLSGIAGNGFVRAIATKVINGGLMSFGTYMVTNGWASSSDATKFEGSAIFLAGFAAHIYDVWVVKHKIATAAANPSSPVAVAAKS